MGSRKNRKSNDQPIIKRPLKAVLETGKGLAEEASELCPISFDAEIRQSPFAVKDAIVELVSRLEFYDIYLGGTMIGQLTNKQSKIITQCGELGIKYKGRVIEDKAKSYARFIRII